MFGATAVFISTILAYCFFWFSIFNNCCRMSKCVKVLYSQSRVWLIVGNPFDIYSSSDYDASDVDLSSLNVKPEYHTGRPTYTCPHCSKTFLYASQLRQHVRFHLKHRPYRCPVCSKTFVQSSNLTEHFRIHSDERPFKCELCEKRFRQSSNLNYHVRTAHKLPVTTTFSITTTHNTTTTTTLQGSQQEVMKFQDKSF